MPLHLRSALALCACFAAAWAAADPNPPTLRSEGGAWPIRRQWTLEETRHFAQWIGRIYDVKANGTRDQRLAKIEAVLTDPAINLLLDPAFAGDGANPQLDAATMNALHGVLDCHKLTVTLTAYYAYRRALPWIVSRVEAPGGADVRTADYTIPVAEMKSLDYPDAGRFLRDAVNASCTGNYRVELNGPNAEWSDTVPVAITREHLIPGAVYYVDGHVLILARVEADGTLRFLDATVSPTRHIYTFNGFYAMSGTTARQSSNAANPYAGCFRGFRIHRWPIAETDAQGNVLRIRRRTDAEMAAFGFSTEQYDRLEEMIATQRIADNGAQWDSFDRFVRARMRTAATVDFEAELAAFAERSQAYFAERDRRVQAAWSHVERNGPVAFPEDDPAGNVFTAAGLWGEFATAFDDAAWRGHYFDLVDRLDGAVALFDRERPGVDLANFDPAGLWSRGDLAISVTRLKNRIFDRTVIVYTGAGGRERSLTLRDIERRMYDLSFDPNHPPELRWGAPPESVPQAGPTPVPGGKALPMIDAYRAQGYYRSLARWEPEPSYLHGVAASGFPLRAGFDAQLRAKWMQRPSPPVVPVLTLAAR